MASADMDQQQVKQALAGMRKQNAALTAPDGPFPLAEEEVSHYGTVQRYKCWQRGPNSLVFHTLPELYGDSFSRYCDQEFLVYEGDRLTYGQAMEVATALARELWATYQIGRGKCVAIAARNYPEWVVSFLSVTGILSSMALPVNSWWMDDEMRYGLEDSKTNLLIADFERVQRAPFLKEMGIPAICIRAGTAAPPHGAARFEEVVAAGRQRLPLPPFPVSQDDRGILMYTSGTTSKPKGVVMSQRGIMSAINTLRLFNYKQEPAPQTVALLASPLFHVNGLHVALLAAIGNGSKLVLMYKWDPTVALELVQAEKVNTLVGVPTNTYDLVNHPNFAKYDTSSLVGVGGGGANFASSMIKKVADKFRKAKAGTGYGLTETNAISVVMPAAFFPAKPTSCGIPAVNVEVCILGDDDKKLPEGEVGEICIRGATIMLEYWGKPDKTAEVFHVDDEGRLWFRSGDIGRLDADGFVYIMDRAKDIIIRGGENISCAEIEGALFEHPSIAEVAAIGVPDEKLGEAVAVAVVFKQDASAPTVDEIKKYAADRLAAFKVPSEFFIWKDPSLPRGATGKMQKREIREQLADYRKGASGKPISRL